jgi:protein TonB
MSTLTIRSPAALIKRRILRQLPSRPASTSRKTFAPPAGIEPARRQILPLVAAALGVALLLHALAWFTLSRGSHDAVVVKAKTPPIEIEITKPKPLEQAVAQPPPRVAPPSSPPPTASKPRAAPPKAVTPAPAITPAANPAPAQEASPVPAAARETPTPAAAPAPVVSERVTPARGNAAYLNNPAPKYPVMAQSRGWEGQVLLNVHVLADGKPDTVNVTQSSGRNTLDDAAVKAVTEWIFVPAKRGQTAIDGWVQVPIDFKLGK